MNTTAFTALTSCLRVIVVGGTGYSASHRAKPLLRRGCDVVTFDNPSASCHGPLREGEYRQPGNLADRMDPVTSALPLPAYDKHRAADSKAALA